METDLPLSPPPRDGNGVVQPHDHPDILSGDDIIRRISSHLIVEDANGGRKISSMAYKPSSGPNGGMSIDIKKSIEDVGIDPATFVTSPTWIASVILKVDVPRGLGLKVGSNPVQGNDHHGEVWGKFKGSTTKALQKSAQWFVEMPGVSLF